MNCDNINERPGFNSQCAHHKIIRDVILSRAHSSMTEHSDLNLRAVVLRQNNSNAFSSVGRAIDVKSICQWFKSIKANSGVN